MDAWDGWPFARVYLLLLAVGFLSLGAQVLLFHWSAGFSRVTMYGPVLLAPFVALAALVAAVVRDGVFGWIVRIQSLHATRRRTAPASPHVWARLEALRVVARTIPRGD